MRVVRLRAPALSHTRLEQSTKWMMALLDLQDGSESIEDNRVMAWHVYASVIKVSHLAHLAVEKKDHEGSFFWVDYSSQPMFMSLSFGS
jgi:hypothetical protein